MLFYQATEAIPHSDHGLKPYVPKKDKNEDTENIQEKIKQFLSVLDKLSKLMNSTSKGRQFLNDNHLPKVNSAYRVVDFPDVYKICNRSEPCTCQGDLIKCKKPDCPPRPRDPKRCAGEPICFEDCKTVLVEVRKVDNKNRELDLSFNPANSITLRKFVKALPEKELPKLADELTDIAVDLHNQQGTISGSRSIMGRSNYTIPTKPDWVNPAIKMTIEMRELADQIVELIKLATHAAKVIRKATVCPCHEDQCLKGQDSIDSLRKCEGICINNKNCKFWKCECPAQHPHSSTTKKPVGPTKKPRTKIPKGSTTKQPGDLTTEAPKKSTTEAPKKSTTKAPTKSTTKAPKKLTTKAPGGKPSSTTSKGSSRSSDFGDDIFDEY